MDAQLDAVIGQISMQALGAAGLPRPFVRRLDLDFQTSITCTRGDGGRFRHAW
jgi:hypothetical protein